MWHKWSKKEQTRTLKTKKNIPQSKRAMQQCRSEMNKTKPLKLIKITKQYVSITIRNREL